MEAFFVSPPRVTLAVVLGLALAGCAGVRSTGSLAVSPSEATLKTQQALAFDIQGQPPYTFEVIQGSGLVSSETRQFVAPNTPSTSYLRIRDAEGRESVVVVKTEPKLPSDGACAALTLAIVDSGIDLSHPDLAGRIWKNPKEIPDNGIDDDGNGYVDDVVGWNFAHDNAQPNDDNYHGTHVAGAAAGVASKEGRRPASESECQEAISLLPVKLFDAYGVTTSSDIVASLRYAVDAGAQVINASFGARMTGTKLPAPLAETLAYIESAGVSLVAAAGNYGQDLERFPIFPASATNANILTVAATNDAARLSSFSNYGTAQVDIAAPGEYIESTFPTIVTPGMRDAGRFRARRDSLSGTSVSAPLVSGALSRLWSRHPAFSQSEAREQLLREAQNSPALNGGVANGRLLREETTNIGP